MNILAISGLRKEGCQNGYKDLHKIFGHPNAQTLAKTAEFYGIEATGELKPCESCALAKAKQKNVPKSTKTESQVPGERLFIDISSIKHTSYGGKKYWLLIVDDCTDTCWSYFLKHKSDQVEQVLIPFIKHMKARHNRQVRYIRCDNAGENQSLEIACKHDPTAKWKS